MDRAGEGDAKEIGTREYRAQRELLKARLWAQRVGTPDDFLRGDRSMIPPPASVRCAGGFITSAPDTQRERKHRATGKRRGRLDNGDVGLTQAVYTLMTRRGISKHAAIREISWWLAKIGNCTFKAARERVYRALSN